MLLAGDWRVTGGVLKIACHIWEVAMAGLPVTSRRRRAFSTLSAAVWTRAGNGSMGHGSWVKWVTKIGWVTWVMGH